MLIKESIRLIKSSYKRFLSLFMIVFIGTALMVGLLSTPYIMRDSVDSYYDDNNLFDIELLSNYGFSEDDKEALKKSDGVKELFASKFKDTYTLKNDEEIVIRFEEIERNINLFVLKEGRLPVADNEALVVQTSGYDSYTIGKEIKAFLKEGDLSEDLDNDTYIIVGICETPEYLARLKETSTLDNQQISSVFYIPANNFKADYYTALFMTLDGSKELISFTDRYDDFIKDKKPLFEDIAEQRKGLRKEELVKEAEDKIAEGKKELEEKKLDAQRKINDAQKKLEEGKKEVEDNSKKINDGKNEINKNRKKLDEASSSLNEQEKQLNEAIKQVEEQFNMSFDDAYTLVENTYNQYLTLLENKKQLEDTISKRNELETSLAEVNAALEQIAIYKPQKESLESQLAYLIAQKEAIGDGDTSEIDNQINNIQQILALLEQEETLLNTKAQLIAGIDAINQNDPDNALIAVNAGISAIDAQIPDIATVYTNLKSLKDSQTKIADGKNEIKANYKKLDDAQKKLDEGESEINKAKEKIAEGEKEIKDAKKELAKKTKEAEKKIRDGEEDLKDLPDAKWYVLTRKENYHTVFFTNTLNQMHSIANVIPLLFFLVAALVCLTTMTRLLDESRLELGTLSALGFSKFRIISKYLIYALLASLFGSVLGIVFGVMLFPGVIYHEWRLIYDLPEMLFGYYLMPSLIGILSFSLLMVSVTYFVAYKSLKEMPSQLMRPKAPKNMRKVFLENIGFIWNHLSFVSKITMRNIIRYKARFFMTVIGVAGCTGLLVMGFSIKDSIRDVVNLQYGEIFKYDHIVNLNDDVDLEEIEALNYDVAPFMSYSAKIYDLDKNEYDETITVQVFNPDEIAHYIALKDVKTGDEVKLDGILISEKYAINHGLNVGDHIYLEDEEGRKREVEINRIVEMYFEHYLFMPYDLYKEIYGIEAFPNSLASYLNEREVLELKENPNVISVTDFSRFTDNFENMIKALDIIILVIVLAAGSLAFAVLINLTQVNISERIREIATLKVLGFTNKEVSSYLYKEIILLAFLGSLIGLPLGVVEHHFVMNVINMDQIMFGKNISFFSYSISFVITMIFTFIVLLLTKKSLAKIKMVESLKSVE